MATEKNLFEIQNKNIFNRPDTLYGMMLVISSASNEQVKKSYRNMSLLTQPDVGGIEKLFKTMNWAFQIPSNDAAQEAHFFRLDDVE